MTTINPLKITIAGGTGMIGSALENMFIEEGHEVMILTRSPKKKNHVKWDPSENYVDLVKIEDTNIIINVCGAPIDEKRWTDDRKKVLISSRVVPGEFLADKSVELPKLQQYITVSGINCYGFERREKPYIEEDPYGQDFTSQLVKKWEAPVEKFPAHVNTVILRLGIVLTDIGGALPKMIKPFKMGIGSPFGSGDQIMTWVYLEELKRIFRFMVERQLSGMYNVTQDNTTNKDFMKAIAQRLNRSLLPVNVPSFTFKMIFGQMSEILLEGVPVSNQKLIDTGFQFKTKSLEDVLAQLDL